MPLFSTRLISMLLAVVLLLFAGVNAEQTITIYTWPLGAAKPQELAQLTYNEHNTLRTPSISNYKVPSAPAAGEKGLVRVGFYDPTTKEWQGVATQANSFDTKFQQKISLHLDPDNQPWRVGFTAYPKPNPTQKVVRQGQEREVVPQLIAEVVPPSPAPTPHLNKPVVLSPEGKVEGKEEEQKTFLQKYWWIFAAFAVIQLASGAIGGDDAKAK